MYQQIHPQFRCKMREASFVKRDACKIAYSKIRDTKYELRSKFMKTVVVICTLVVSLVGFCYAEDVGKVNSANIDSAQLRQFLARGYASAKTVLDDSRIIFEKKATYAPDWLKQNKL